LAFLTATYLNSKRIKSVRTGVFHRQTFGSLKVELLIPGRKFTPGKNWGRKNKDSKFLLFCFRTVTYFYQILMLFLFVALVLVASMLCNKILI